MTENEEVAKKIEIIEKLQFKVDILKDVDRIKSTDKDTMRRDHPFITAISDRAIEKNNQGEYGSYICSEEDAFVFVMYYGQVCNGGHSQWECNGYFDATGYEVESLLCRITKTIGGEVAETLYKIYRKAKTACEMLEENTDLCDEEERYAITEAHQDLDECDQDFYDLDNYGLEGDRTDAILDVAEEYFKKEIYAEV